MSVKEFFIISSITSVLTISSFFVVRFMADNLPQMQNNIALATTIKPESFTELYFEDHLNLPRSVKPNEQQTFSFTVYNLEQKTMVYPYAIYVEDASGSASVIVADQVTIRHGEHKTITEWFEILQPISRAKVVVNLTNKKQEIHFWIGEENK